MHSPHPLELWGRCTTCRRWFYIQSRHTDAVTWPCPVCAAEPERVENRAHPNHPAATRRDVVSETAGSGAPKRWHG